MAAAKLVNQNENFILPASRGYGIDNTVAPENEWDYDSN